MNHSNYYQLGPDSTPPFIKYLLIITASLSIICALLEPFFVEFIGMPGLQTWLSLSSFGLHQGFLWQPFTYLFIQNGGGQGITLNFLMILVFNLYILWSMGTTLVNSLGPKPFLRLYLLSGIIAALSGWLMMALLETPALFAGPTACLVSVLIVWALLYPSQQILLFFFFPMQAKWLVVLLISAILLINLSHFDLITLIFYLSSMLFSYVYAVTAWHLNSPFAWMAPIDTFLLKASSYLARFFPFKTSTLTDKAKVFDIHTGQPSYTDDQFMDAMLTKISRQGERSLSWRERKRMQKISETKRRSKF